MSPGKNNRFPKVHFFLSDEGFGHIVRQEAIIRELMRRIPNVQVTAQTHKRLGVMKEKFGDRISYLDKYNNIHTVKTPEGSLDLAGTRGIFQNYPEASERWLKEMKQLDLDFDFALSDFVPEAFTYCKEKGVPCFGVAHFTWDWFMGEIWKDLGPARDTMEHHVENAVKLYFPPFTPSENLRRYGKQVKEVSFIINEFAPVKLKERTGGDALKCLIMDNGTNTLSRVIEKSIPELAGLGSVQFYVCVDNLGETARRQIEASSNVFPVSGLRETHSHIPLVDFVIARGGFNTLTECLITRTPALLVEEGGNPEIAGNIAMVCEKGLAGRFDISDFNQSLGRRLEQFVEKELPLVRETLLQTRFENSGPSEIVEDILQGVWK